jgi:hypothetical protein
MRYRIFTLAILSLLAATLFVYPRLNSTEASSATAAVGADPLQQRGRATAGQRRRQAAARRRPRVDYSKFSHTSARHRALSCDRCHTIPSPNWRQTRKGEAFPDVTDYPDHPSCVNCHRQQFFVGARPVICTVCHTNVSPRNGNRFAFQNPRENAQNPIRKPRSQSQFAVNFPHDKHQDVMALVRPSFQGEASFVKASFRPQETQVADHCTTCHQTYEPQGESDEKLMAGRPEKIEEADWPRKGTFKTSPTSHAACFDCHWKDGGVAPLSSDCAGCHVQRRVAPGIGVQRVRSDAKPEVAQAIKDEDIRQKYLSRQSVKFRHEITKHMTERGCTGCHINVTSLDTVTTTTLDVPLLTCGNCHIGNKKVLNAEVERRRKTEATDKPFQCVKCHVVAGAGAIPKSHNDAVPLPKPK